MQDIIKFEKFFFQEIRMIKDSLQLKFVIYITTCLYNYKK